MPTQIKGNDTSTFGGNVDVTGNVITDAPLFRAKFSANQSVSTATNTIMQFDTIQYDTNNCFNTTNYRFTPNVAGYYKVTIGCYLVTSYRFIMHIYKNGSSHVILIDDDADVGFSRVNGSALVYLNGTTDYINAVGWLQAGDLSFKVDIGTFFEAHLARAV